MASFETQWRATFEDTKQHQEKLRVKLDELDEKNRCVSEKDRESFSAWLHPQPCPNRSASVDQQTQIRAGYRSFARREKIEQRAMGQTGRCILRE